MASNFPHRQITSRDIEILASLDRTPLTVQQLLRLSETFQNEAFPSSRVVQRRLQQLRETGFVRSWPYARAERGTPPDYFRLTEQGFRLLHGPGIPVPKKRHFSEIGVALHHHTHSLAEVLVHLLVGCHQAGVRLIEFYRENSLSLMAEGETICPDGAFELLTPDGRQLNYVLELDNSTESIRSPKDVETWQRKIRVYHALQDAQLSLGRRFRVLTITTRDSDRLEHILWLSGEMSPDKRRSLFIGSTLTGLLATRDPIGEACFRDHRGRPQPLVLPKKRSTSISLLPERLAPAAGVC